MKKMTFKLIPCIIIGCLALLILISMNIGYWNTESTKIPKKITSGPLEGSYDPYDIRGSYMIEDVLEVFSIPKKDFYQGLKLDNSISIMTQLKDLEGQIIGDEEFEVSLVRDFVAEYIGLVTPDLILVETNSENNSDLVDEHSEAFTSPKGGTPLTQVYEWGITEKMLEDKFNINMKKLGLNQVSTLKDLANATGISMNDLKVFITDNRQQ